VLAVAGQRGRLDVVRVLLSSGADPEARSNDGEPALSMATKGLLEADTQSESGLISKSA
jgi:ankyrin repeat protein